ncbi:hypothetical protein BOX15_Mlig012661g1, partial [Macrostomum lignano]
LIFVQTIWALGFDFISVWSNLLTIMATACLPATSPGSNSVFSPIALFECTISNAQMLVESMELVDLILAQKIVCQLQCRLVEVMEPSAGRLAQIAELYNNGSSNGRRDEQQKPPKQSESQLNNQQSESHSLQKSILSIGIKEEEAGAAAAEDNGGDDDEVPDCEASREEFGASGTAGMLWSDEASESNTLSLGNHSQLLLSTGAGGTSSTASVSGAAGASGGAASSATGGGGALSDRWKQLLRRSYRSIKEQCGELFDFTKSYSAPVNLKAAQAIINRAVSMTSQPPPDVESWKNSILVETFMRYWFKDILRRNYRRQHQPRHGWASRAAKKLSQRQRSYDNLQAHGALSPVDTARLRALLDLQYTSSDDEVPADEGDSSSTVLRVKRLSWESAEAARLKAMLDRHFAEVIANPRERRELERVRRHPAWISQRPTPDSPQAWAVVGWGDAATTANMTATDTADNPAAGFHF